MSRRRKALYVFLGLAVMLGLFAAKIIVQVRRGEEIFWLAELWAPAAALSIGVVTGIEFLITPGHGGHSAPTSAAPTPKPKTAVRKPRRPAPKTAKK